MASEPSLSRGKAIAFSVILFLTSLLLAATLAEIVARLLESRDTVESTMVTASDPELGWLPEPGIARVEGPEFTVEYRINEFGMSDDAVEDVDEIDLRIAALGDSHTFAVGASTDETWPNVLESMLREDGAGPRESVFNLGVVGYSLGQYLVRFRRMKDVLKPNLVIVGFSMATDLYDLIPPSRGGFVYGAEHGRIYFDLDDSGELVERDDLVGHTISKEERSQARSMSLKLRGFMTQNVALYRRLKRSRIAVWVATHYRPGGLSLWPGLDTALKVRLDEGDEYRWKLADRLLEELATEVHESGAGIVVVNIPYLAQVYDEIWSSSFGTQPEKYDRWIAGKRLEEICRRAGILYVDTTPEFVEEAKRVGHWLHYARDAHPTPEGHRLIARTVASFLRSAELLSPALAARGVSN